MVSNLLELPIIRQRALAITVEKYHALGEQRLIPERVELLEGVIIEKTSKSPLHSAVTQKLARRLRAAAKADFDVRQEQPITCEYSEPEPDLALVEASIDDYARGHPTTAKLIIEISVSSEEIDRRKKAIYAAANVHEYWIVLPEYGQTEVYSDLSESDYIEHRIISPGRVATSEILPAFSVDLAELFLQ